MSYYAIGIGGTGAKCLESLIYLAAAGLMPENNEPLFILFIDPDGANGSLGRAGELLEIYKEGQSNRIAGAPFLKTQIISSINRVWSPLTEQNNNLGNYVSYGTLDTPLKHLFNILYSPQEKETSLDKGFRGHPSIGAAVMASAVNLDSVEPWKKIKQEIELQTNSGKQVKVMLFGSIFGGTGASGFPTVARLFKNWSKQINEKPFQIGGTLMLPYFSFETVGGGELKAEAKDFLLNTQAALQYYYQKNEIEDFDATYLLGSHDPRQVRTTAIGGQQQENDPHWIELYAGLAALDFFYGSSKREGYQLIARENSNNLAWTDLPDPTGNKLRNNLLQMARFSFAYLSTYYPTIREISNNPGQSYRAPWYVDFLERKNIDTRSSLQRELKKTEEFCRKYLLWFANLEYSVTGNISDRDTHLLGFTPFAEEHEDERGRKFLELREKFYLDDFKKILLPDMQEKNSDLASLWRRMCEVRPSSNNNDSAWLFINELYRQCGN